jgi:hypothetical protein
VRLAELAAQIVEIGRALSIDRHGLAVKNGCTCRQQLYCLRNRSEAFSPVIAIAGVDGGAACREMRLRAVAVPLDLMCPRLTGRWPFNLGGVEIAYAWWLLCQLWGLSLGLKRSRH